MAVRRNVRSRYIHAQAKCDVASEPQRYRRLSKFLQRCIACIAIGRTISAILTIKSILLVLLLLFRSNTPKFIFIFIFLLYLFIITNSHCRIYSYSQIYVTFITIFVCKAQCYLFFHCLPEMRFFSTSYSSNVLLLVSQFDQFSSISAINRHHCAHNAHKLGVLPRIYGKRRG